MGQNQPTQEGSVKQGMRRMKYADVNPLTKVHPGEPWFFIRAQDKLSVDAVMAYSRLLQAEADKLIRRGEIDKGELLMKDSIEVTVYAHRFLDWQEENPDKVKLPD